MRRYGTAAARHRHAGRHLRLGRGVPRLPPIHTYDRLVLDVRMGRMSGLELQRQLCGRIPGLPVVFVTAHEDPGTRREAERQGCVAFFGKTESGNLVIDALRNAAARYRSTSRPTTP